MQYIRSEAQALRIAPNRIGLLCTSAGAHLAALVSLDTQSDYFTGAYPLDKHTKAIGKVKVVAGVYDIYDMVANWNNYNRQVPGDNANEVFLGATSADDRKVYFEASPMSYPVRADNSVAMPFVGSGRRSREFSRTV